ncbi:hypothetical protein ACWKW1_27300 [Brevibacillus parabrevis]
MQDVIDLLILKMNRKLDGRIVIGQTSADGIGGVGGYHVFFEADQRGRGGSKDKEGETKGTERPLKAQTRAEIMNVVQDTLSQALQKIKEVDPNAKVGYRGSLATGQKGPHKGNAPFDPNDFDIDAFIVSDKLAETFSKNVYWRSARKVSDDLNQLQDKLELNFRNTLPGYRYEPDKPFTFRIYTEKEFNKKIFDSGIEFIE